MLPLCAPFAGQQPAIRGFAPGGEGAGDLVARDLALEYGARPAITVRVPVGSHRAPDRVGLDGHHVDVDPGTGVGIQRLVALLGRIRRCRVVSNSERGREGDLDLSV